MLKQVTDSHPAVDDADVQRLQGHLGFELPGSYLNFLRKYNGGRLEPSAFALGWNDPRLAKRFPKGSVHVMFCIDGGSSSDLLVNLESYEERIPAGTLPIGMDPGGNLILIGLTAPHTGRVMFWVQDREVDWERGELPDFSNVGLAAQSFDEFLHTLDEL